MKIIKRIILIVVLIAVAYFAIGKKVGQFNPIKWFKSDVVIADTENIVTHIRGMAEYTTLCYYDEFVLNYVKNNAGSKSRLNQFAMETFNTEIISKDQMVLICKGKVRAGIDLGKITEEDIVVNKDTLNITVPEAEYFDVIINPSDFEYFDRTGNWSHKQDMEVKQHAKERLLQDAQKNNILAKAEKIGHERLVEFYKNLGFKAVKITVKK